MTDTKAQNLALWSLAFRTDPAHVKPITGKQYKGNSPKPYWITQRATELLGPCGIGWGVEILDERFENLGGSEILHVARVKVWYVWDGKRGEIQQIGQTRAAYMTAEKRNEKGDVITAARLMIDEDAPKKSVTDGMVKALSMIGFAGDIFSGRWDDSKYQAELREEARVEKLASDIPSNRQPPRVQPSNQTIGDAEFKTLVALLDETGADKAAFCEAYGVTSVAALPLVRFADATAKLREKKRRAEIRRANNAAVQQQQGPAYYDYDQDDAKAEAVHAEMAGRDYDPMQDSANQAVEFE
jgi:hypothetical protein